MTLPLPADFPSGGVARMRVRCYAQTYALLGR